jgi:ribosomal protein S10
LQIVGNAMNSFDMDKVDYECRDVIMTGMQQQLDCSSFIPLATQHCKVSVDT